MLLSALSFIRVMKCAQFICMWTRKITKACVKNSTKCKFYKKKCISWDTFVIMIIDKHIKFTVNMRNRNTIIKYI